MEFIIRVEIIVYMFLTLSISSLSITNSAFAQTLSPGVQLPVIPYLPLVATSIAITASIFLYYYQERRKKRLTIARARTAILKELVENKVALTGGGHERIQYRIQHPNEQSKLITYTNAYLEADSYNSVLYSGLLTYFSVSTLHTLTMLYSRMKSRNDLLTYMDHLEDMFFLHDDKYDQMQVWQKKVEKYDLLITMWEKEIIELLDKSRKLLENEQVTQRKFP